MEHQHKVSCICVSHPSRFGFLQQAIDNYINLAYPRRELIVIVDQPAYYDMVRSCSLVNRADIRVSLAPFQTPTEGFLLAMSWASGEWVACWDDDNLSSPDRINFQIQQSPNEASLLSSSLYYFYDSDELFVTEYVRPSGDTHERAALGSLMLPRKSLPAVDVRARGPWSLQVLKGIGYDYLLLPGRPELFLVGGHNDNWRSSELHRKMGTALPRTWTRAELLEQAETVEKWLQAYKFPQDSVNVCGKDAQAFKVIDVPVSPIPKDLLQVSFEDWRDRIPGPQRDHLERAERDALRAAQQEAEKIEDGQ